MNAQTERGTSQALVARQPIVDRSGALVAYELLFRSDADRARAVFDDGVRATTNVILNTISEFGVDRVLGAAGGFVNLCQRWIDPEQLAVLPPERFTLELLETVEFDAATIARCKELREQGYALALDDVSEISTIPPEMLELVDVVKVDVGVASDAAIERILADARRGRWRVLAEKVETAEQYARLHEKGFDLFQGHFVARPELLAQRRLPKSASALIGLLRLLHEEPSVDQLEALVKQTPTLLARLMKLAQSSPRSSLGGQALTVREAITRVGVKTLSRWVQLLIFSGEVWIDLASNPLFQMVAVRARFMELLSQAVAPDDVASSDAAYQTGMYSLLHVLTGQPQAEFLAELSISREQRSAIESGEGMLGQMLRVAEVIDFDRGGVDAVRQLGLSERKIMALHYQASIAVAKDMSRQTFEGLSLRKGQ